MNSCFKTTRCLLLAHRFVDEISKLFKFQITNLFLWSLLSIACVLLTFLSQIVEYHIIIHAIEIYSVSLICIKFNPNIVVQIFPLISCHRTKSDQNSNPLELIFTLILMFASFFVIFLFCEFGEMINDRNGMFNAELYQCHWHAFPIEMQQMLLTFMTNTQRPATMHGFGNTECTREAFKNVNALAVDEFTRITIFILMNFHNCFFPFVYSNRR